MTFDTRVREAFPEHADQILGIIRNKIDPESFPAVRSWVNQCYNRPSKPELKIAAIDALLNGYGVEGFCTDVSGRSGVSYVNFGDTYDTTILLISDHGSYRWCVSSWGDYVEENNL